MAQTIEIGTLLVKAGTILPESLPLESDPYLKGWRLVKNLGSSGMDRKLFEVGWTFFDMAGEVKAMAFGSDSEKTTCRAVEKVIANMKPDRFNCLEISRVAAKSFLGLPYVTVAAHPRHIQESLYLFHPMHISEWNQARLAAIQTEANSKVSSPLKEDSPDQRSRTGRFSIRAVLVAAPLIRSQDVKPSEAKVNVVQPLPIPEMGSQQGRVLDGWLQAVPVSAPAMGTLDLSRYRNFQFGETLAAVAKQAGLALSDVKLIHERPAVIQELEWPIWLAGSSLAPTDPVKTILFSFYNGELFRIVVNYDWNETEGLTTGDMIEAISAKYGTATEPARTEIAFSSTQVYNDSEAVTARWEDSQYSFNLYRSTFQPTFGMMAFSKKLDALARAATTEAIRLDAQGAPQREIQRQKREDDKNRELLEKTRQVNKSNFRL